MKAKPEFLTCEECDADSLPNPWPNTAVKELTCSECDTIHEIEWVDDVDYN